MAAEAKKTEDSGDEKVDLFIAPFQQQYSEAIHEAREAAATTATPAWQNLYKSNIDQHRSLVKSNIERIENTCESISAGDTYEEAEKDIKDAVKHLADERVRFGAWRQRAVNPYESSADKCTGILERVQRAASDAESDNPLHDRGLALAVHDRIAKWPRAEWNNDKGAVEITEQEK